MRKFDDFFNKKTLRKDNLEDAVESYYIAFFL